jgi:hypothetical protein
MEFNEYQYAFLVRQRLTELRTAAAHRAAVAAITARPAALRLRRPLRRVFVRVVALLEGRRHRARWADASASAGRASDLRGTGGKGSADLLRIGVGFEPVEEPRGTGRGPLVRGMLVSGHHDDVERGGRPASVLVDLAQQRS